MAVGLVIGATLPMTGIMNAGLKLGDLDEANSEEYQTLATLSDNDLVKAYLHAVRSENRRFLTKMEIKRMKRLVAEESRRETRARLTR